MCNLHHCTISKLGPEHTRSLEPPSHSMAGERLCHFIPLARCRHVHSAYSGRTRTTGNGHCAVPTSRRKREKDSNGASWNRTYHTIETESCETAGGHSLPTRAAPRGRVSVRGTPLRGVRGAGGSAYQEFSCCLLVLDSTSRLESTLVSNSEVS